MTDTGHRLLTAVSSWFREAWSRYGTSIVVLCILGLGVLAVLLVQPSPLTFTEGWSAPLGIDEVRGGHPHRAVIDGRGHIHLAWEKRENRKDVAVYARLDRHGALIGDPVPLSDPGVNAGDVALVLTGEDAPLCFWIEKGHQDGTQRLMMAWPEAGQPAQVLSTSPRIMRDLAVTGDEEGRVFLAWSDNRQGLYDIYMTALDNQGRLTVSERRITNSGTAFVLEPALAAGRGVVHVVYFADKVTDQELVHQVYDLTGEPLAELQVLEWVSQSAVSLGGGSGQQSTYPLLAVAGADGQLHLYETLGPIVRWRKVDRHGATAMPAEPLLMGSQHYSAVDLVRRGEERWLIWADLRWGGGDRFQVYAAPLDSAGRAEEEARLTFATTSALWPVMAVDSEGGQHVIWQQSTGPYTYQLMYINNLDPARISAWQRLGFSGVGGAWGFVLALAQSAILAVITSFINIWRPAIAWAVTALALQIGQRVEALESYSRAVAWVALLATLFVAVSPEVKTLGQMPIVVAPAVHWVMGAAASVVVLYLGRIWLDRFRGVLIWAGLAGLWLWVYYFLNLTLVLREGFAV